MRIAGSGVGLVVSGAEDGFVLMQLGEPGNLIGGIAVQDDQLAADFAQLGINFVERSLDEGETPVVSILQLIEDALIEHEDDRDRIAAIRSGR